MGMFIPNLLSIGRITKFLRYWKTCQIIYFKKECVVSGNSWVRRIIAFIQLEALALFDISMVWGVWVPRAILRENLPFNFRRLNNRLSPFQARCRNTVMKPITCQSTVIFIICTVVCQSQPYKRFWRYAILLLLSFCRHPQVEEISRYSNNNLNSCYAISSVVFIFFYFSSLELL